MLELFFSILLFVGIVEPMNEQNDERDMYVLYLEDGGIIEHAYKEEILLYIQTGEFEYDETYMNE
jgi:hypothetical protein